MTIARPLLPGNPHGGLSWEDDGSKVRALPVALKGKTVLDIGGYNGAYSFECRWRGAAHCTVLDNGQYRHYDLVAKDGWIDPPQYDGVTFVTGDFMAWEEPSDVVLLYNVVYHVPDWEGALRKVRALTRETLCLSSSFVPGASGWRVFDETEDRRAHGKPLPTHRTVFAKPTLPGLFVSLGQAGFERFEWCSIWGDHVVVRCA